MATDRDGNVIRTEGCSEWSCLYHGEENRRKYDEAWKDADERR